MQLISQMTFHHRLFFTILVVEEFPVAERSLKVTKGHQHHMISYQY